MDPFWMFALGVVGTWFLTRDNKAAIAATASQAIGFGADPNVGPASNQPVGATPGAPTARAGQAGDSGILPPYMTPGPADPSGPGPVPLDNIGQYKPLGWYGKQYGNFPGSFPPITPRYTPLKSDPDNSSANSQGGFNLGSGYR